MANQKRKISGEVIPFNFNDSSPIDISQISQHDIIKQRDNNGNGGGSDMDKYATKEELKTLETKIDGQFNTLDAKIDGYFKNIDTQFKNADNQFKQVNSKLNWLFGIIAAVIIAGLSKLFFG